MENFVTQGIFIRNVIWIAAILSCHLANAGYDVLTPPDSIKKTTTKSHWRLNVRAHSKALFNYGGRVASENPSGDINFIYDRKKWGLFAFKAFDMRDHHTFYNFSLITLYKNFKISDRLTITPHVGTFLEQAEGMADKGSDIVCMVFTTFKVSPKITAEFLTLSGNLIIEPELQDWVNRVRLMYSSKHLEINTSFWYNSGVFDNSSYCTTALNVAYSRVKLANNLLASTGVTGLVTPYRSDKTDTSAKSIFLFTIGLHIVK